jgi:hypothetical protein
MTGSTAVAPGTTNGSPCQSSGQPLVSVLRIAVAPTPASIAMTIQ